MGFAFPNVPYIIDGDFKITESKAVTVYICDRWAPALMGSTPEERATIIMLQQVLIDAFFTGARSAMSNEDREALYEAFKGALEPFIAYLGDKDFMHGSEIRLSDFYVWELIETTNAAAGDDRFMQ